MRKKGTLRKITINKEVWHWIVQPERWAGAVREVRIYSPSKKMFRVSGGVLTTETMYVGAEGEYPTNIKPAQIRKYILECLIKLK